LYNVEKFDLVLLLLLLPLPLLLAGESARW
jgi:hypothetical protein